MKYELTNEQRRYFGLDSIKENLDREIINGDSVEPESIVYFEKNNLKIRIVSSEDTYLEKQYNERTKGRIILLPKTDKGKEKKITPSVLDQCRPMGVYLSINGSELLLGNYGTQTRFYSSYWDKEEFAYGAVPELID